MSISKEICHHSFRITMANTLLQECTDEADKVQVISNSDNQTVFMFQLNE